MSREPRKGYYNNRDWDRNRDRNRDRDRERDRNFSDYRHRPPIRKRSSRSPNRRDDRKRSRSPRKNDKDLLDENILSEISKLPDLPDPSELWDSQFQDGGFSAPPPPSFVPPPPEGVNANYNTNYQPPYPGMYDDFPSVASLPQAPLPPDIAAWNQMSLPPPPPAQGPPIAPPAPFLNNEDQMKKDAAIETEMRHQKAALSKQREDYVKKASILKKELDTLKDQRTELRGDAKRSPSPDTKRFLKENTKLQLEIQNKLKTIHNVVDMLNGIIGEEAPEIHHDSDDSAERSSKRKSRSPSANKKFNYVYYDPEMHWCRVCNDFPPTAKDYLNHLHSAAHQKMAAAHMEAPWHTVSGVNEGFPSFPSAPTKRTPIKGLQFFVPSTAWYCKLCDQFIGDLHCASAHLKSVTHSKNYTNFVEQNPHWETDWMSDRQKAFEKSRGNKNTKSDGEKPQQYTAHTITFNKDGFHTKTKDSPSAGEEKKKKKDKKTKKKRKKSSSSSSSSDSSSSDSEQAKKKSKEKKSKKSSKGDDNTLTEWMSSIQVDKLSDNDRKLFDNIKVRIKNERNAARRSPDRNRTSAREKERLMELQKRLRESERDRTRSRVHSNRSRSRSRSRRSESRSRREGSRRRDTTPPTSDAKKPEVKKMPFIGKMPVFKNLTKVKVEEQKKEEQKKKEEDEEVTKKKREELDAEIQKKVADFKEKIARAQQEREQAQAQAQPSLPPELLALMPNPGAGLLPNPFLPPPALAQPTQLSQPPPALTPQPSQMPPQPTLPKDFQEALDIIFPTDVKKDLGQDLFGMPPGFMSGLLPSFPPLPMMNPQMFGFDLNAPIFQPRPQLYDTHVPMIPGSKHRPQQKRQQKNDYMKKKHENTKNQYQQEQKQQQQKIKIKEETVVKTEKAESDRKKAEMEELAMLGIDASDVGAGI